MNDKELIGQLRTVPDFPVKDILFWDVTTLFKNPAALSEVVDRITEIYKDKGITKVAGIEIHADAITHDDLPGNRRDGARLRRTGKEATAVLNL